jgi:uncharacterized protein with HEPN domain
MKKLDVYLQSILEAIARIEDFKNRGVDDDITSKALMYELVTIGEAVMKIPDSVRSQYPEVMWRDIVAFRNVLVHGYLGVNMDAVEYVVSNELDHLADTVHKIMSELG